MIKIGKYRHRITIQLRETVTNHNGFTADEWLNFHTCWAYVSGLSGQEFWAAQAVQAENTVNFKIRYSPYLEKLNSKDYRLVFKDDVYNITSVDFVRFENKAVIIKAVKLEGDTDET